MSEEFDVSKEIHNLQCGIRQLKASAIANKLKQENQNISDMKRKELMLDLEHIERKIQLKETFLSELKNKKYS